MTGPISMDIRDRAMARLDAGETVPAVAEALSVVKWSQRRRVTGSAAPGKNGGHVPRKVAIGAPLVRATMATIEEADWLRTQMAAGAFTLRGLGAELAERGLEVDYRTIWALAYAEGLSFKGNRAGQSAGAARRGPQARPLEGTSGQHRPDTADVHR
jgi:putative transposase